MAKHAKTLQMIDQAYAILAAVNPMTVRQVYYQLVSRHALKNSQSHYDAVCNALRDARLEGVIPWEWIEDRTRRPRKVPMWKDLTAFAQVAEQYRRILDQGILDTYWHSTFAEASSCQVKLTFYGEKGISRKMAL